MDAVAGKVDIVDGKVDNVGDKLEKVNEREGKYLGCELMLLCLRCQIWE